MVNGKGDDVCKLLPSDYHEQMTYFGQSIGVYRNSIIVGLIYNENKVSNMSVHSFELA